MEIILDLNKQSRILFCFSGEADERKRPVIIHRAILGSVERMMAILTENYGGKWPFWLSPRQAIVIPVSPKYDDYANKVRTSFLVLIDSFHNDLEKLEKRPKFK